MAVAAGLFALAALCLWPIIETQQRASAGVFILSMVCILALSFWQAPRRAFILICGLALTLAFCWPGVEASLGDLERKTALVGANMRFEEWRAVWAEIATHPLSLIFGAGWGATFASPAVGDIEVNFTHGLLSTLLLKTGVLGLVLGLIYLAFLARGGMGLWCRQPVLALALAGPILIDALLYASFKSLDFGLMLALVAVHSFYGDGTARSVEGS